jgi:hypothetical protein
MSGFGGSVAVSAASKRSAHMSGFGGSVAVSAASKRSAHMSGFGGSGIVATFATMYKLVGILYVEKVLQFLYKYR